MNDVEYQIKITGSGTAEQIATRLKSLADEILKANDPDILEEARWEDPILYTEIDIWEDLPSESPEEKALRNNTFNGANLD